MEHSTLVVMNYNAGSVEFTDVPKGITSEEAEDTLVFLGYNLDEVHYMITDNFTVNQIDKP
jgi:hypothetical protein